MFIVKKKDSEFYMGWKTAFYAEVKRYLTSSERYDPVTNMHEVTNVYSDIEYGGFCSTCSYEEEVTVIEYVDSNGITHTTRESISFREFMNQLA